VGSDWYEAIQAMGRDVKEQTGGEVCFEVYGGGVMGDESAMILKVRTGQLDAAVVTSVGLGDIDPGLLALQLPLIFRDTRQLDCVRDKMTASLEELLLAKQFVLLGWGDVGFSYLFSNTAVSTPEEIKGTRLWVWDKDPVAAQLARVVGVTPVPLSAPDVLPRLTSGDVDAFLASPYGATALQWHPRAKYVTDLKLAASVGGTVISQKALEGLTPEQQKVLREVSAAQHRELLARVRRSNEDAQKLLVKRHGYTAVPVKDLKPWLEVARQVKDGVTGAPLPPALVSALEGHLKACQ
jgi:TRAP-type C4-dicarboxylate transport system substrate-binding protein